VDPDIQWWLESLNTMIQITQSYDFKNWLSTTQQYHLKYTKKKNTTENNDL